MGSLVQLLGIEGCADAEGDAGAEEHVVGDGCDAAVVDLDLFVRHISEMLVCQVPKGTHCMKEMGLASLPWQTK